MMEVCRFYSLKVSDILEMKCCHFMAHLQAIVPLRSRENIMKLRIATNPMLLNDQQDLVEDLKEGADWSDKERLTSEKAFYNGIAAIERARSNK